MSETSSNVIMCRRVARGIHIMDSAYKYMYGQGGVVLHWIAIYTVHARDRFSQSFQSKGTSVCCKGCVAGQIQTKS